MGIFSKIKKRLKNLSLTDEKAWDKSLWNVGGGCSLSGENVTESNAMTYSAIWNAVTLYSGTVSTLPLNLLRKDNKKTVKATEKKLYRVLHDRFNPFMTAQIGREVMMAHVLLWGNAYCEIVRNGFGEVIELWPITPNRVKKLMVDGDIVYEITVDSKPVYLANEKVLHIPGIGFDGFVGYSVVGMAQKSFGLSMALESFGSLYFGQGTHPGIVISHPGILSETAHKNLQNSLANEYSGLGKAHRLMLMEENMKVEKIDIPPEDSQFLESRQFQIAEVARWFNLPPHKLKDLSRSSFSNIESEQISFVTDSVLPWLVRIEQNYNMQLLSESEQYKQNLFTRHNVDGLLRGSPAARADYYTKMWGIGVFSINYILAKEGEDPVEGGDERFVPMNMIPLSKVDQQFEKPPTPANNEIIELRPEDEV